jgi:N-acetylglucosaminyl-diphospho-decaprenol L-rhamnosyltransferase
VTARVAAVLVNYNGGPELRRALQSIAEELGTTPWEGVVVDNASTDGSDLLAAEFPQVQLIRNRDNVGFSRAVNQGIAASAAPLILMMNPDSRLLPRAMTTLESELESHPDCAIAGPRILNPDGSVQGSARGDPDMLTGLLGRTTLLTRLLPGLSMLSRNVMTEEAIRSGASSMVVDWVSGACMLARREALHAVSGFDERYFLYWEDADLCRRLRTAGYHVRYVPGASAYHRVGHSSRKVRTSSIRAFHASAYLYYKTHVAPGRVNAKRMIARVALAARCRWVLRDGRGG